MYNIIMKKIVSSILILFLLLSGLCAEKTSVKGLFSYKLDNGLELFVAENHSVPLVYIEICCKCGAYTQDKKTAGLFHLYEHMMFKGNSRYKTAQEFTKGLKNLGVTAHNGSTGLETVNYFFTVPVEKLEEGLEFWSLAVRTPLITKTELEAEKKVVLSEIAEDLSDPARKYYAAKNKILFPDSPWKLSPGGSMDAVRKATVKQLEEIQKKYYVPNNSALFVGGDVNPDEVFELVKKIYGDWKKAEDPFESRGKSTLVNHPKNPLKKAVYRVMPFDKLSSDVCEISVEFRGPDAAYDIEDTYSADMLFNCISNPGSYFKQFYTEECNLGLPDKEYISAGYLTLRTCGRIHIVADILSEGGNIPGRAEELVKNLVPALKESVARLDDESFALVKQRLKDSFIYERETSEGLAGSLRYYWAVCSDDYYYTYQDKLASVTKEQMEKFIDDYIASLNPLVTILINPELYESMKSDFENAGCLKLID